MRSHCPKNKITLSRNHAPPAVAEVKRASPSARGYGTAWKKLRLMVLARSPLCVMCRAPAKDVDHILPMAKGGVDTLANLQTLCKRCHSKKTYKENPSGGWRNRQRKKQK